MAEPSPHLDGSWYSKYMTYLVARQKRDQHTARVITQTRPRQHQIEWLLVRNPPYSYGMDAILIDASTIIT
jgi:hypothetical protein